MTNKIIINENFCLYLIGIIGFIVMMQSQTLGEIYDIVGFAHLRGLYTF